MIGFCRNGDPTGSSDRFEADGDVHIVAEYFVFVGQHVSHVDAQTKPHGPVRRKMIVPFRHHLLHRDRRLDCSNDAWKLQQEAVAGVLHNPAAMIENDRIDRASMGLERGVGSCLVGAHHSRIAGDVGADDCG